MFQKKPLTPDLKSIIDYAYLAAQNMMKNPNAEKQDVHPILESLLEQTLRVHDIANYDTHIYFPQLDELIKKYKERYNEDF